MIRVSVQPHGVLRAVTIVIIPILQICKLKLHSWQYVLCHMREK